MNAMNDIKSSRGSKIGNITQYWDTPCPHTFNYYSKQINDSIKEALRDNPAWINPKSKVEILGIIEDIRELYHPAPANDSKMLGDMWNKALGELQEKLSSKLSPVRKTRRGEVSQCGQRYTPEPIHEVVIGLVRQGMSITTIAACLDMHSSTLRSIIYGCGPYAQRIVTEYVYRVVRYLEEMGYSLKGWIIGENHAYQQK